MTCTAVSLPYSGVATTANRSAPAQAVAGFLRHAGGALLVAALVVAPLNLGSTRPAGLWLLVGFLGAAALCWSAGSFLRSTLPPAPPVMLGGLLALGLSLLPWMTGAVATGATSGFTTAHFARVAARWPYSVVAADPALLVALHAGLGLALWMTADLARQRGWLLAFALGVVITAVLVTVLALAQNQTGAPGIYWREEGRLPGRFWGTFFHHTSAGAYLNSAWPLAGALAITLPRPAAQRAALATFVLLLGAQASHVARLPAVLALLLLAALALRFRPALTRRRAAAAGAVVASVLLLVATFGQLGELARRWRLLGSDRPKIVRPVPPEAAWPGLVRDDLLIPNHYNDRAGGDRGEAQRAALRAIADRPLLGYGPGAWRNAASLYSTDPYVRSFYLYLQFVHEDFLQAWVEWGVAGFPSPTLLLPGAVVVGSRLPAGTGESPVIWAAAAGVGGVLLQSLLDFPLQIPAVALNTSVLAGLAWTAARHPRSVVDRSPA